MFAKFIKGALIIAGSMALGKVAGKRIAETYPEEVAHVRGRIRANKQAGYYRKLQAAGLFDDSEVGLKITALYDEHINVDGVAKVFVGAVVPYDGQRAVTFIEGIQQADGQMTIFVNSVELLHGTNTQFDVIQICEGLQEETGALILNRFYKSEFVN